MLIPSIPNRSTKVVFDEHLPSCINPAVYLERTASEMAKSNIAVKTNIEYIEGIGWRLKSYQSDPGATHEKTAASSGILGLASWSAGAGLEEYNSFKKAPYTGVSYSGAVHASGSPVIQKRIGASDSWNGAIAGDSLAYPAPDTGNDTADMDRSLVLLTNHDPTDEIYLRFYVPGSRGSVSGSLLTLYFSGPAGDNDGDPGTGQYALKFSGHGFAEIFEKLDGGDWLKRHQFPWCRPMSIFGGVHFVRIANDCKAIAGFPGTKIVTIPDSVPQSNSPVEALISVASANIRTPETARRAGWIYDVPRADENPTTQAPLRIDIRRDVRAVVQISKAVYPTSGVLFDDIVSIDFFPTDDNPFYVQAWGDIPSGTSLNVQLYDAETGIELSGGTTTYSTNKGIERSYTPNVRQRYYRVKVSFTSDTAATPTLTHWDIFRDPVFETPSIATVEGPAVTDLVKYSVQDVSISGPRKESGQDGASFNFIDMPADVDRLKVRGGIPIKITTEYNEYGDESVLFRGYTVTNDRGIGGGYNNGFGDNTNLSDKYSVSCDGEWHRLYQAQVPLRYSWRNAATGEFYTITTIIRSLLAHAYPLSMVDVPEIDIKPFGNDPEAMIMEPGTPIGDMVTKLASDYLGAFIVFDTNAGTDGMWRLLQPKTAPYTPLARFYRSAPSGKIPHVVGAYGTSTSGSQTVLHGYCENYRSWIEEPEGNMVTVFGGASSASGSATGGTSRITQVAVNTNSFNPFNLADSDPAYPDTTHPDYIGRLVPIQIIDSTLTTQSAVNWVCRRVFDYACHAREFVEFTGPLLLVTDDSDSEQTRPRPLRVYDIVELEQDDGSFLEYICVGCDPTYRKDILQRAKYILVRPSNMTEKASLSRLGTLKDILEKMARNAVGSKNVFGMDFGANKSFSTGAANAFMLPEVFNNPLQDLDPTSGTYGQFYFMPDFDALP